MITFLAVISYLYMVIIDTHERDASKRKCTQYPIVMTVVFLHHASQNYATPTQTIKNEFAVLFYTICLKKKNFNRLENLSFGVTFSSKFFLMNI